MLRNARLDPSCTCPRQRSKVEFQSSRLFLLPTDANALHALRASVNEGGWLGRGVDGRGREKRDDGWRGENTKQHLLPQIEWRGTRMDR